jgi:hypothetical protein
MIQIEDIYSLTDFQRNVKAHLQSMKKTGRPRVLTVNGKAELIVQDARAYQNLLDMVDQVDAIEGVRRGLESIKHGAGRPANEVFEAIRGYGCPNVDKETVPQGSMRELHRAQAHLFSRMRRQERKFVHGLKRNSSVLQTSQRQVEYCVLSSRGLPQTVPGVLYNVISRNRTSCRIKEQKSNKTCLS